MINESGIVIKKDVLSIEELAVAARSSGAGAIAIDNIFEIGSEGDLRRLSALLADVDIIQVTGSPAEGFRTLASLGKELGFSLGEKLSPSRSAEICALAVLAGRGSIVKVYEPETRISISRRRRFGTGGMSEGRYRRSIQGSVLNLTNSIESSLNSRRLDFDLTLRRGSHGVEGATFFVYASRNRLVGLVRPIRTSSVDVRVTPVYAKSLEYAPLTKEEGAKPKRYLMVGVDPGMVTGLAAIDLNGRVLRLMSGRGVTRGQITRWISGMGKAMVISSDVNPPPSLVSKLASSQGAMLFAPEASLKASEKKALAERAAEEQGSVAEDTHQRAALAAVLKAFAFYRNKLEQAASHARKDGRMVNLDEVKANVLRGMSINDAIEASSLPVFEESLPGRRRAGSEREQIRVLEGKCQDLREERDRLEAEIKGLEARIEDLENALRLQRLDQGPRRTKDDEIYELERRISSLMGENSSLRGHMELLKSESLRVKEGMAAVAVGGKTIMLRHRTLASAINSITADSPPQFILAESMGRLDEACLKKLGKIRPAAIILQEPTEEEKTILWEAGVPVVPLSSLGSETVDGVEVVDRPTLEEALGRAKFEMEGSRVVGAKKFRQIFDDYRKERTMEP